MSNHLNVLSTKRVLCADDDKTLLSNLTEILKLFFKEVVSVDNGELALENAIEGSFDVLIFDITMPHMNGLDVVKEVRKTDKNIPIVIVSAHHNEDYLMKAMDLRLTRFVFKPFTKDSILEALDRVASDILGNNKRFDIAKNHYYDFCTKHIYKNDKPIKLSKSESRLIEFFLSNTNNVISYNDILDYMYDFEKPTKEAIKAIVKEIRKKTSNKFIKNVYGVGYICEV